MRLALFLSTLLLSGCAGLSINADFYGTYRSEVPIGGRSDSPKSVFEIIPLPSRPINPGLKL